MGFELFSIVQKYFSVRTRIAGMMKHRQNVANQILLRDCGQLIICVETKDFQFRSKNGAFLVIGVSWSSN
jgi:hypothetical protein